jgi:hypothetical protein
VENRLSIGAPHFNRKETILNARDQQIMDVIKTLTMEDFIHLRKHVIVDETLTRSSPPEGTFDVPVAQTIEHLARELEDWKHPPVEWARAAGEWTLMFLLSTVTPCISQLLETQLLDEFLTEVGTT